MRGMIIALGIFAFAVAGSATAYGDGCIVIMSWDEKVSGQKPVQSAQQAELFWSGGTETLHLRSNYTGPSADFAWVIPVPARPTVKQSTWTAFEVAEQATRPSLFVHHVATSEPSFEFGCSATGVIDSETQLMSRGVVVLESLDIKEFHVDILVATEGGGLMRWLQENGYAVPDKAAIVLDEYIRASFYFVAVKVAKAELPKSFASHPKSAAALTPLAISFDCPKPFFPLKISSISSAPENELLLLVVTDEPVKPNEYPFVHLTQDDVYAAFKAGGLYIPESANVDFDPAVRIAQGRSEIPALVLEARRRLVRRELSPERRGAAVTDDYSKDELTAVNLELDAIRKPEKFGPYCISRFRAFLKPQDMKDITFSTTAGGDVTGQFFVELQAEHRPTTLALAPACLIAAGAVGVAFSGAFRRGTKARLVSVLLLFLAACMM
jgi:hypothetical protein